MASKRHERRKGCERKKRYENEQHALADASAIFRRTGQPINVYRCRAGHIHVGHIPAKVRQAIAARRESA